MLGGYNILGSAAESPCGFHACYGTYSQYFQRQYTDIMPHNIIYFSFTFSEIDTWDASDTFQVVFDSVTIANGWSLLWENWSVKQNTCGSSTYPDQVGIRVFGKVAHSGSSLTLKFVMQNDEPSSNESAGFRDVKLIFATVSDEISSSSPDLCGIPTAASYTSQVCICPEGFYTDESGVCRACNALCSSCFGPSANQCYWYEDINQWTGGSSTNSSTNTSTNTTSPDVPGKQPINSLHEPIQEKQQYFQFFPLARSVYYARYLATYLPPRLEKLLDHSPSNLFPINSQSTMPATLRNHFANSTIPSVFAKHNIHSNFLVNYWGEIITFFFLVILTLLLILFDKAQGQKKTFPRKAVFLQVTSLIKWNFPMVLLAFNVDYIILFTSLQVSSGHLSSSLNKVGLLFCLIFLLLCSALLAGIYYVVRHTLSVSLQANEDNVRVNRLYASVYVFYGGYRRENKFTRYFYLIYIIRRALPSIIACTLYRSPVVQAMLYLIISVYMLVFVTYKRPLTRKTNHFQLIIQEVLNLLVNLSLVILVFLETDTLKYIRSIEILGDVVIVANCLLNFVAIIFLVIKLSIEAHKAWKLRRTENCFSSGVWISFISIYVQQAAFGFEEIAQDRSIFQNSTRYVCPDASVHTVFAKDLNYAPSLAQGNLEDPSRGQEANNEVNVQIAEDQDHTNKPPLYPDFQKALYPDLPPPNYLYFPQPPHIVITQALYPALSQPIEENQELEDRNDDLIDLDQAIHNQQFVLQIHPINVNVIENESIQQAESNYTFKMETLNNKPSISIANAYKGDYVSKF